VSLYTNVKVCFPPDPVAGVALTGAAGLTPKLFPLLATPPTVTTTLPVVAPAGTGATMLVLLQLVGVACTPLNVTVLVPWVGTKPLPVIVIGTPTGPELAERPPIAGATVNSDPLLETPPTLTTTFPVSAPLGTFTTMLVSLQLVGVPGKLLKVTVLVPCVAPKPTPAIVTGVLIGAVDGVSDVNCAAANAWIEHAKIKSHESAGKTLRSIRICR
jgi:hypothetical protein